jgi:FkbM family methyltransferase
MKKLINTILSKFGYELKRISDSRFRHTDQWSLQVAAKNGLNVATIIDVGAAFGDWSRMAIKAFPHAQYILVEPLPQYDEWLTPLLAEFSNFTRIKAAAADCTGSMTFNIHEDWCGSSLLHEVEGDVVDGQPIQVETVTLDEVIQQQNVSGPFFIKLDVQGAEDLVLRGAKSILRQTECLLVETSMFEFYKGGPLIHDVIATMRHYDFVIYDIINLQYRLLDNALSQADLVFVPSNSHLRKYHVYASPHQRLEQNKNFIRDRKPNT